MYSSDDMIEIGTPRIEDRQVALEYLAEAWNTADKDGVSSEALAHAGLHAALATLVRLYGEELTATLIDELPERVMAGEYSLQKISQ